MNKTPLTPKADKTSTLSKLDRAIQVIQYIFKKRKLKLAELDRKIEMTEREKIFRGEETEVIHNVELLIKHFKDDADRHLGRLPSQAIDLEQAVLGAIILVGSLDPEKSPLNEVKSFLEADHFYFSGHQQIYQAIETLDKAGMAIDMRTVVEQLRKDGTVHSAGNAHYIAELTSKVSQAYNVQQHARIIVEKAIKRELTKIAGRLMSDGYDETVDCFEMLAEVEQRIKTVNSWIKQ